MPRAVPLWVAEAGDCVACHTVPGGKPFAGGLAMQTPIGTVYSTNITPDLKTGTGGYSYAEFAAAVRRGIAKDGHHLYPAMPYPSYAMVSDADMKALYAYFIDGVEAVDLQALLYQRTVRVPHLGQSLSGWVQARFVPALCSVDFLLSESLIPALPRLMADLRQLLDLDADPAAIASALGERFVGLEGLRVPGTMDGLELAVRGILGQQITVAAARTLCIRLVQAVGLPLQTPFPALSHVFPGAEELAALSADRLGALGIVRQRQAAILALAQTVASQSISLRPGGDVAATMSALQRLPGIGPWTAGYIAMRALRWPDAFPSGDVALQSALGLRQLKAPALEAERMAQAWRPWRSYAVVRAWHSLTNPTAIENDIPKSA